MENSLSATLGPRLAAIVAQARALGPIAVAVVDAAEEHVLAGAIEAAAAGLIQPTLIGQRRQIEALWQDQRLAGEPFPIVYAASQADAAEKAVAEVLAGRAQALMKGWIHTDVLMHPVLAHLRSGRRVSHVFVAELATYHKLLFVTDAAINIEPDLATKAAIVQNAVDLARLLGIERPKVAALSAVEVVQPAIRSTIDAACLSKMAERGQIAHAFVDGPLAFDNAISKEAARIKKIDSPVAGDVDILLAPDLAAGNILAKDLEYLAKATLAGVVVGATVPIVLPSRSDPPAARIASCAIALLVGRQWDRAADDAPAPPGAR